MALTSKEILVTTDTNMYVMQKPDGSYGLTNKENATMFSGTKAAKDAIQWCRKHVYILAITGMKNSEGKNNYFLLDKTPIDVVYCNYMIDEQEQELNSM